MSRIIDSKSTICERAMQDLYKGRPDAHSGANGMSVEQVIRAAILIKEKE